MWILRDSNSWSWLDLPELNWRPQTYQVCALTYWAKVQWMVAGDRLELSTSEVWAQRSDRLNYPAIWRTQSELNRRHLVFQTSTLTTTELHVRDWSFRSDSNRRSRCCRPLPFLLATEAWQELRELNSYQWFWRPLFYRWTKLLKNKRWLFLAITHRNLVVDQLYIVSIALFLDAWLLY